MTDVLAERCAALAVAVVPLLSAAIQSQGSPKALDDVIAQVEAVRAVVLAGGADAAGSAFAGWAGVAPGILDQMETAARAGDPATVWALFTDQANGFHRLGAICAGYPGW